MLDWREVVANAPLASSFFDGFDAREIALEEGHLFCRIGGEGPPLVLLHGYPQTSAMWHAVAPRLAESYTVICPDLRGYGRSWKPGSLPDHASYSKRATGADVFELMTHLGHERFLIGAHDRGARVAHRMAADNPARVRAWSILDIAPTREMYAQTTAAFAADYWHWFWLVRPAPIPERQIALDPRGYWIDKLYRSKIFQAPFLRQALEEYLDAFDDSEVIRGSCEDYRAAYSIDIQHDNADSGLVQPPLQTLWGAKGAIEKHFDCLALWRQRAASVEGHSLPGGHFLAEELPDQVLAAWLPFFAKAP